MAHMLDGRITGLWGTHTHVPTSDTQVLPHGTGYVTDLGMTGPKNGILGVQVKQSVAKFRGDLTGRYQWENGPTKLEAVLFTADPETGLCLKAERVDLYD
jgi:calcineurin-like phosphoesterase